MQGKLGFDYAMGIELLFLIYILYLQEVELELPPAFRECFVELHPILKAIEKHDVQPALEYVVWVNVLTTKSPKI